MRQLKEKSPEAAKFAQDHWKEVLLASSTLAGAAILLLIRFHKNRKQESGDQEEDQELSVYEGEAEGGNHDVPVLLETGTSVVGHIENAEELTQQLAEGLPDDKSREMMETLGIVKR